MIRRFAAAFLFLGACSEPTCRPNEIKVGMICERLPERDAATANPDAAVIDSSAPSLDGAGLLEGDGSSAIDADAQGPSPVLEVDAATCQPGSTGCVQCRPETEEADCRAIKNCNSASEDCAGGACDPKTFACARQLRGTVKQCEPCVSDSECVADHRCVPMTFSSKALGNFCLQRAAPYCTKPYSTVIHRESASGYLPDDYCGLDEVATSCPAILLSNMTQACTSNESCAVPGAICEQVSSLGNRCTYSCKIGFECYEGVSCGGANKHCGGS